MVRIKTSLVDHMVLVVVLVHLHGARHLASSTPLPPRRWNCTLPKTKLKRRRPKKWYEQGTVRSQRKDPGRNVDKRETIPRACLVILLPQRYTIVENNVLRASSKKTVQQDARARQVCHAFEKVVHAAALQLYRQWRPDRAGGRCIGPHELCRYLNSRCAAKR